MSTIPMERPDPTAIFKIVDECLFPGGLLCPGCGRQLSDGDPFIEHPEGMTADGVIIDIISCVYCRTEAMVT